MLDWKPFLTQWSRDLLKSDLAATLDPPPDSPDWLGFPPATPTDIAALEARLGLLLPPSYRSFLLTTNGWRRTTPFVARLRPAANVDFFRVENEDWADIYAESGSRLPDRKYYDYARHGGADHRAKHMRSLVQIADVDDGVYLLNPDAVTPDGEWEAWFVANWVPGAQRAPSFAHLMLNEYKSFLELTKLPPPPSVPSLPIPSPAMPRVRAKRARKKAPSAPSLEDLIAQLQSPDNATRNKAVHTLYRGKLKGRPCAARRPDLLAPLTALFYAAPDPDVRGACVAALTELTPDDAPAPTPLFDALSDPDPGVVLQGMFALSYFPDPRALEPLCRFLDSGANALFKDSAMHHLRELGDERAVPVLARILFDATNTFDQNFSTAALALAQCGSAGFDALVTAAAHPDPRIRLAAVVGLDTSGNPDATPVLKRLATDDTDPDIRNRAKVRVGNPWR